MPSSIVYKTLSEPAVQSETELIVTSVYPGYFPFTSDNVELSVILLWLIEI